MNRQGSVVKHLVIYFDRKSSFYHDINEIVSKVTKGSNTIRRLRSIFPRAALLTIYKSLVALQLNLGMLYMNNQIVQLLVKNSKTLNIKDVLQ